jgi:hypothetical protein
MKMVLRFFLIIACFTLLFSCSEDTPNNPFVGTWTYINQTFTNCDNSSDNGTFDFECNATDCYRLTFQSNRKLIFESLIAGSATTTEGSYSFENDKLTLCSTGCDDPVTFTVSANTLILTNEDDAGCTVATLLEKTM